MRRDYDPDLERDDFETRELNAGGVRAKRIREQHDSESEETEDNDGEEAS